MKLSIIIPCYNESLSVNLFFDETKNHIESIRQSTEFIFVNDGSKDDTLEQLKKLKDNQSDYYISILDFSRNFGKEAGILAGLENANGDYVVIMDADLQDPPFLLPKMLEELEKGDYDSVATYRVDRKGEPPIVAFSHVNSIRSLIRSEILISLMERAIIE